MVSEIALRDARMCDTQLRDIKIQDAAQICDIYNYYIKHTVVTFEEVEVTEADIRSRIELITKKPLPWIVCVENDRILGYAYANRWQARSAYRCTVESSVYVNCNSTCKGIGTQLYQELLSRLKQFDVHVVVGCIALPNDPSIALHEKLGFKKVGYFNEVGFKFGQWIDVGYWQRFIKD